MADRIGAQRRSDRALLQIADRRRKSAGAQYQRQVVRFLLAEAAGNAP